MTIYVPPRPLVEKVPCNPTSKYNSLKDLVTKSKYPSHPLDEQNWIRFCQLNGPKLHNPPL